ncbi:LCP family protein [Alkalihalobacillus sp. AL-G]|uniref:LCP family protein n=1 Tax=Alkalihalobacillus sp. AL-G TaxID=2926399 RepID=UPI00272A61CC|nr:LCP family protein [Alkalihalobacillus sp. AL-G]WLD92986.1 LCP family protein [Alkalihalobacillus sp. AL-G]
MDRIENRRQLKKRRRRRVLLILLPILAILLTAGCYGTYLTYKLANATSNSHQALDRGVKSVKRIEPVDPKKDNISILFVGVDDRNPDERGRSDVLILATFNKEDKSIKMVSLPRDSRVEIPDHGRDKINHAHAFGGMDLTVKTVENLFDIPVDYYAKFNFNAFIEVINALDGVRVNVPFTFSVQNSQDEHNAITLEKGYQTLSGEEALGFVRMRKQDPRGDIGRGERQQQVIKAIIKKGASLSSITKYDDVIESIGDNLTTNLTFGNLVALQKYSGSLRSVETVKLEGYDDWTDYGYYYGLNEESINAVSLELKEHLELLNDVKNEDGYKSEF